MSDRKPYPQRARERIAGTKVIERLMQHVTGEIDMTPTQVRAAAILLNKVLPDLKSVDVGVSSQLDKVTCHRLSDEELMAIAASKYRDDSIEGELVASPKRIEQSTVD